MTDTTLDLCQKSRERESNGANLPVAVDAQKAFLPFGSPVVMAVGLERVPTIGAFSFPPARRQNRIPE